VPCVHGVRSKPRRFDKPPFRPAHLLQRVCVVDFAKRAEWPGSSCPISPVIRIARVERGTSFTWHRRRTLRESLWVNSTRANAFFQVLSAQLNCRIFSPSGGSTQWVHSPTGAVPMDHVLRPIHQDYLRPRNIRGRGRWSGPSTRNLCKAVAVIVLETYPKKDQYPGL